MSDSTTNTDTENASSSTTVKTWSSNGRVTLQNPGAETILISKTSKDSIHIMKGSTCSILEKFIPDNSNGSFILISYAGYLNGVYTTVSFNAGETLSALKTRTTSE